jgi:hypothetical protein
MLTQLGREIAIGETRWSLAVRSSYFYAFGTNGWLKQYNKT